ncbi:phage/plasmid primase, P4 family [Angustibacter sp. McL0619]|uniref:phage/plasmid primase, P4 family n=1 Tax=Angustibacter sp. McL0619 TaxID=3415676 RepID=UPI003CF7AE92
MPDLLATAQAMLAAGLAPLPLRADGSKAPAVNWKPYVDTPPPADVVTSWFTSTDTDGIGTITGAAAGNLEMLEVEGRAIHLAAQLRTLMHDNGLGDLWDLIATGWLEATPSGGLHWHYRVDGPARPNTKLARRPATTDELAAKPGERIKVLIETRGQGGFTVLAPSAGRSHPTGNPWTLAAGGPATIPTISVDERDALHAIAAILDEMPTEVDGPPARSQDGQTVRDGSRPGDDYNTRTSWADILEPHGWKRTRHFGGTCYGWKRPGKTDPGISATTGRNDADNLYVFSSSTEFETEKAYSKFAVYTLLDHDGDYTAAAKALAADGYGHRGEANRPTADDLAGLIAPSTTATNGNAALAHQPAPQPAQPRLRVVQPTTYSETDDGNALRLVDDHGHQLRYCPQRATWLHWDGTRWRWDTEGLATELARTVARNLPADDKAADRHRRNTLSRRGINAMTALAATDARTVVHLAGLDARPYELNTPAGILDMRTATLRPADPAALHTRSTDVAPDLDTEPTRWLRFLADTFAGDQALTTYIQRLLGVSLLGVVLEQVLPFAFGPGANGKTTLVGVVQRIVGIGDDGYSISAPAEMLLAGTQQGHPTEIARLAGARLVVTSELEDGQRFAEAKVKNLTGRDTISGRFMRQDWFSFTPTHSLWLLANHQPAVRAGGPAFWRRLRLLPFLHTVPADQRIADLEDQLVEAEGPAILGWIAQGAADYLTHGLAEPDSVLAATDAYASDQDTVGRFVDEVCETGPASAQHLHVKVTELRAAYETWCRAEGETPVSAKALTLELRSRYDVQSERSMSARFYAGIRLCDVSSDGDTEPSWAPHQQSDDEFWGRS